MLKGAGKEAMAEGRCGWIPISTREFGNLGFLLQALGAQRCPHRVVATAVPGWLKQGTAWCLFWLHSPCALDVCPLGSVSSTTLKSPRDFSGVNSMPVGSRKGFRLNAP